MNKILLRSLLFTSALLLMSTSAYAATCTSTADGDWHNMAQVNWSCNVVPAAGDDVNINHDVSFTADIAQVNNITILDGGTLIQKNTNQQIITGDMVIEEGGILTHGDNSTTHDYELDFQMENLDLQLGGSIDVSEKGYDGGDDWDLFDTPGSGDGFGPAPGLSAEHVSIGGSGAGNGGRGGDSYGEYGASEVCNIDNPSDLGSGGGGGLVTLGGDGGGLIVLDINDTATLNGAVNLNGGNGTDENGGAASGAGSGGSMLLEARVLTGIPTSFTANGGDGGDEISTASKSGGSGGGGCIKLIHTTDTNFNENNISVIGGTTDVIVSPYLTINGLFNADGTACTDEQISNSTCGGYRIFNGFNGQVEMTQNVVGMIPEFSTYVYMLTLLSALTIMYYFGRAKKLTV